MHFDVDGTVHLECCIDFMPWTYVIFDIKLTYYMYVALMMQGNFLIHEQI